MSIYWTLFLGHIAASLDWLIDTPHTGLRLAESLHHTLKFNTTTSNPACYRYRYLFTSTHFTILQRGDWKCM